MASRSRRRSGAPPIPTSPLVQRAQRAAATGNYRDLCALAGQLEAAPPPAPADAAEVQRCLALAGGLRRSPAGLALGLATLALNLAGWVWALGR